MALPRVLLTGQLVFAHPQWNSLSSIAKLEVDESASKAELLAKFAPGGLYHDNLVAIFHTHSTPSAGVMDKEFIDAMPSTVKYISHHGAGYDMIDVAACAARGILVSNTPGSVDDATADTNMFLILGALRGFNKALGNLRQGKWNSGVPLAHDPEGKVLGIIGMGGIGRALKQRAEGFDMEVQYHNRKPLSPELAAGAKYVSFDEIIATSDVLSLNLPLNEHTRHIINKETFAKMKDGVIITNTARGAVIDEAALVEALASGKVACAGLDVFEDEPVIHPGLLANENVMLLPHLGTHTVESRTKMEIKVIDNIRSALTTGKMISVTPETAFLQEGK
ncbi:D-isomer specific 2-hydroxyacid dehydrogenase [Limtongia smithiae]|uniref:D-isomer specific 2-hydroxyacid dehydrogenase n=1 Tax=Limtongia smithiae TaxID=1125753 RepID=UPI0034CDEFC8